MKHATMVLGVFLALCLLAPKGLAQEDGRSIDQLIEATMRHYQETRDASAVASLIETLEGRLASPEQAARYGVSRLRYKIANLSQIAYPSDPSHERAIARYAETIELAEGQDNTYVLLAYRDIAHLLLLRGEPDQAQHYLADLMGINEDLSAKAVAERSRLQYKAPALVFTRPGQEPAVVSEKSEPVIFAGIPKYMPLAEASESHVVAGVEDFATYYALRMSAEEAENALFGESDAYEKYRTPDESATPDQQVMAVVAEQDEDEDVAVTAGNAGSDR